MITISIVVAILVFMIIIVVHEWGHFIAARSCDVYVEEFAIGMGPKLLGRKSKKGTLYAWRLFPIGGFCRMRGEEEAVDEEGSFSKATVGRRMIIVAAGPLMNFVLALVLMMVLTCSYGYIDTRIESVDANYPAAQAGVEAGDRIYAINGHRTHIYSKFSYEMSLNQGEEISLTVKKSDGKLETVSFAPQFDEELSRYRLGFTVKSNGGSLSQIVRDEGAAKLLPSIGNMLHESFWSMCFDVELVVRSFVQLITGQVSSREVAGPIGIVSVIGESYREGIRESFVAALSNVASLVILLSVNLGVLNLFPIPALDGSRLIFLLIEKIRGKKINEKVENWIYTIGFILLMGLMVLIAINDIHNLL